MSWELKRNLIEVLVGGIRVETIDGDEGKHSKTMVLYRFSSPGGGMPLVLPQAYGARLTPQEPRTVGDHIRKRRLAQKLRQKDVAEQLGVTASTVFNWEANTSTPNLRQMPAIIDFLGYNPAPEPDSHTERRVWQRTAQELSQKEDALRMG